MNSADMMMIDKIEKMNRCYMRGMITEHERTKEIMRMAAKRKYSENAVLIASIGIQYPGTSFRSVIIGIFSDIASAND